MKFVRLVAALLSLGIAACATSEPRPATPIESPAPVAVANAPAKAPGDVPSNDVDGGGMAASSVPAPTSPDGRPELAQRIVFDDAKAKITPASLPVLDAVAAALKAHPERFPIVALDGHAAPNEPKPMRLSLERATAVRLALVERGVDGARLVERVSGATVPLCEHSHDICWERERRVEFAILNNPSKSPDAEPAPREGDGSAAASGHPTGVRAQCSAKHGSDAGAEDPDGCLEEKPPAGSPARPDLLDQVIFARGSSVLTPSALPALDLVAGFLKANPTALEIEGHAADGELGPTELARARAEAVRIYLIACGVSARSLIVHSRGSERPACQERTSECRARNRRAELKFSDAHP